MTDHTLSIQDLRAAGEAFRDHEPRNLFYRAATELVSLALDGKTSLSVAESVAVLLQTWNRAYYQYRKFDAQHFTDIEALIDRHLADTDRFRARTVDSLCQDDEGSTTAISIDFETVLGPVGAAKSLHLLAPSFFPLWDRTIAATYGLPLGKAGTNGGLYWQFMGIAAAQYRSVAGAAAVGRNPLKAIDEYNYCKYTKGWI